MTTRFVAIVTLGVFVLSATAVNQTAMGQVNPISPFTSRLTLQNGGENAALITHRDALGKPCLDFEAASKRHVINPDVYDHVVSIQNRCSKLIKLKLCYFKSDQCLDVEVPAQQRKDTVLGIYPRMQNFRYSYQEKF